MPWGRQKTLTVEQIEEAQRLRNTPHTSPVTGRLYKKMDFRRIAKTMNASEGAVRRALGAETANCGYLVNKATSLVVPPKEPIPAHVLIARDLRLNEARSFSAVAFGDPPFSQSALGKRNGKARPEKETGKTRGKWEDTARAWHRSERSGGPITAPNGGRLLAKLAQGHSYRQEA